MGEPPGAFVARQGEVRHLVALVHADDGGHTLVTAAPGMGKTALARHVLREVDGSAGHVLTARPTAFDEQLPFSALSELLSPVGESVIEALPAPQRRALRAALLHDDPGAEVDPRAVAAGLGTVLRTLAPVLIVVDDAHWLDASTRWALGVVLRGAHDGRVRLLALGRPATVEPWLPDDTTEVTLGPLDEEEIYDVVRAELGVELDRGRLDAVARASGGNPSLALEVARLRVQEDDEAVDSSAPAGVDALAEARVRAFPPLTRAALLMAALATEPRVADVAAACDVDVPAFVEALAPAEADGLVRLTDVVEFAHPLFAHAVVHSVAHVTVQAAHARLAEVASGSEARVRHLGHAGDDPDDDLAADLEAAAHEARARGAWDTSLELLERGVTRSPVDSVQRDRRRLVLADWLMVAGRHDRAEALLEELARCHDSDIRCEALLHLGILSQSTGTRRETDAIIARLGAERPSALTLAARLVHLEGSTPRAIRHEQVTGARRILEALESTPDVDRVLAAALTCEGRWHHQRLDPRPELLERAVALQRSAPPPLVLSRADFVLAKQALFADHHDEARAELTRIAKEALALGDDVSAAEVVATLAHVEMRAGQWDRALRLLDRSARLATTDFVPHWFAEVTRMPIVALRGDLAGARRILADAMPHLEHADDPLLWSVAHALHVWSVMGYGLHEEAYEAAGRSWARAQEAELLDVGNVVIVTDHAEAALALGHVAEAEAIHAEGLERANRMGRDSVAAGLERVRVCLLAATGHVEEATEAVPAMLAGYASPDRQPLERGRAHLVAGRVLRRAHAKARARDEVEKATSIFEAIGCPPWEEQARGELDRIGLHHHTGDELTETERRVADLATMGLRNRDIAASAYLSIKTVEANLGRVYRKLGIRGRAELGLALADLPGASPVPAPDTSRVHGEGADGPSTHPVGF
ncbi:AAA family ATPase [Janibacter sp. G56]|uniref:helix-turn-helix transcriptional regulator n=1 Tax=Janibacter sp. G56 TaxID=3418717 RepID=UPI003D00B5DE